MTKKTELENTKENSSNSEEKDLKESSKKIDDLNNRLLRALADTENLRKNHEKEKRRHTKIWLFIFCAPNP